MRILVLILALFAVQCIVAYVLPTDAHSNPVYVQHVLNAAVGACDDEDEERFKETFARMLVGFVNVNASRAKCAPVAANRS